MANFGLLTAEIGSGVWGTPANFNWFHVLALLLHPTSLTRGQPNFGRSLPWKYRTQKWCKRSPYGHHCTTLSGCIFATRACIDNRKKLVMISSTCPTIWCNGWDRFGSLGNQQISTGFASCLCYCSDVAHRRPTKLCTMFGRLLGSYTIYTVLAALVLTEFRLVQNSLYVSKSSILLHWQRYCTALQQWASAKPCVVQGMELRKFRRGCTSAGWLSLWALAHILVTAIFSFCLTA